MRLLLPACALVLASVACAQASQASAPSQAGAMAPNETVLLARIERAESVDSKTLNVEPQQMWCALDLEVVEVTSATPASQVVKKDDKMRVYARDVCGARVAGKSIRVAVSLRGGPNATERWWVTRFIEDAKE